MVKGKDFYGSTVTDAIAEACQKLSTSQDALSIEILETGSSGIFGLCRKKAHIRVTKKVEQRDSANQDDKQIDKQKETEKKREQQSETCKRTPVVKDDDAGEKAPEQTSPAQTSPAQALTTRTPTARQESKKTGAKPKPKSQRTRRAEADQLPPELPSEERITEIQEDISTMLELMGFPSTVTVTLKKQTVACHISHEYEEELVGKEGRTLDSLQYLL
ncbi:MAG: hypothetical protein D3916_07410, partial [Candidatus Electrothrix sp. MAN1_4]|nr:hypothetical protein [Candidatus Electrothrix sp. MAN1_4]